MIAYDLFLTFVESFILSLFIASVFDLVHERKEIVILTLLFIIETFIFNNVYINNFMLLIFELITALIFLYHHIKKVTFFQIFIICLGIALIIISNIISIFIGSSLFGVSLNMMGTHISFYLFATMLSKVIYAFIILLKWKVKFHFKG